MLANRNRYFPLQYLPYSFLSLKSFPHMHTLTHTDKRPRAHRQVSFVFYWILAASVSPDPELCLLDLGNPSPWTTTQTIFNICFKFIFDKKTNKLYIDGFRLYGGSTYNFPTLQWCKSETFSKNQLLCSLIRKQIPLSLLLSHPHQPAIKFKASTILQAHIFNCVC